MKCMNAVRNVPILNLTIQDPRYITIEAIIGGGEFGEVVLVNQRGRTCCEFYFLTVERFTQFFNS